MLESTTEGPGGAAARSVQSLKPVKVFPRSQARSDRLACCHETAFINVKMSGSEQSSVWLTLLLADVQTEKDAQLFLFLLTNKIMSFSID